MTEIICNKTMFNRSEDDLGYLIWQLMKTWQRGKQKVLSEFELTGSQMEVLCSIGRLQEENVAITQIILSQDTCIDPMTISTILKNLQKKGMINRKDCKTDMRARTVELTEIGSGILQKAFIKAQENKQIILESIDEEVFKTQIKCLLSAINKLETQSNN